MSSRQRPTQAVILAGGRGTRLRPLTDTRPKPMIEFAGKPFLEHTVEMLRDQGFERVLMLLGYLPDVIRDHFGDGSRLGMEIEYSVTEPDDLTGHRMKVAREMLDSTFLLLYCDNYWPMDMDRMWERFSAHDVPAMVTIYRNRDGYTKNTVKVGDDGFVALYDKYRTRADELAGTEISYAILDRSVVDLLPEEDVLFEVGVYPALTEQHRLLAYETDHRYYSVGSHERLPLTEEFFARRPAVLLDRDGVLNRRPPKAEYVRSTADFEWLPGAREALGMLSGAGYRVIVVSNQAGIARGAMTQSDLDAVNAYMSEDAGRAGGRIDAIYSCPHGWDEGCDCRKPRPGMLFAAQRDFHLDLSRTWFIGDDERDAEAADAAGCRSTLVDDDTSLLQLARKLLNGGIEH